MDVASALMLLNKALDHGAEPFTPLDVLGEVLTGRATVFVAGESFLICTLHTDGERREAHAWLGAGSIEDIAGPLSAQAEFWAQANGAEMATIDGRKGWERVLKKRGYKVDGDELKKALN